MMVMFLLIAFSFSGTFVKAGILVEPYYGMAFTGDGDFKAELKEVTLEYSALFPGFRLGYQHLGFMLGADYAFSSFKLEETKDTKHKETVERTDFGLVLGYSFPIMPLRFWAKWILQSKLKGSKKNGDEPHFSKDARFAGGGQSLGVGWKFVPFISFNLEYRFISYDDYKRNGKKVENYNNNLDLSDIFFSVSVPLTF